MKPEDKIQQALELAFRYGQIDGDWHKMWVIDQMVRVLTGDKYEEWVRTYVGEDETDPYEWDVGIAP